MEECYFLPVTILKRNTPPWAFSMFFKIVQMVPNPAKHLTLPKATFHKYFNVKSRHVLYIYLLFLHKAL